MKAKTNTAIFCLGYIGFVLSHATPVLSHVLRGKKTVYSGITILSGSVIGPLGLIETTLEIFEGRDWRGFLFSMMAAWLLVGTAVILASPIGYFKNIKSKVPLFFLATSILNSIAFINTLGKEFTPEYGFYCLNAAALVLILAFVFKSPGAISPKDKEEEGIRRLAKWRL